MTLAGFTAPLDPDGRASLYGAPPWRFAGHSLTVVAEADADALAALVPPPLRPCGPPQVRVSVHDLVCDLGLGWAFAQAEPARSQMREAVVAVAVEHEGVAGFYDPFLWCDSDAEIAVGREMFGWPQRAGDLWLTRPHPLHGWRTGDAMAGRVSAAGRPVLDVAMTLDAPGDLPGSVPAFSTFYTMRVLPDPTGGPTVREVYASTMAEVTVSDSWTGPASLALAAPELRALGAGAVVGARCNRIGWVKGTSRRVG